MLWARYGFLLQYSRHFRTLSHAFAFKLMPVCKCMMENLKTKVILPENVTDQKTI
jgi:hypothetical protein